ncbi:MAG: DEAD/DEAH box helicase [Thermofilaceae archaeon]|nr:DEAD/DEAH box helicase [Thermofilaceae archaeon]
MRVEELALPENVKTALLRRGINSLFPPQEMAVRSGLLDNENLVVAAPTASGKTLIAILAAANHLTRRGGKVLYLTPLRSLASEKYDELYDLFSEIGFKVALSVGDYDSSDEWLEKFDIIITTNEKADSLLRHKALWLRSVSLVVADEIHLVGDASRGPTLELLISRLKRIIPSAQILGLSATVSNVKEIAEWLNAKPLSCDWRPVLLKEGVYYEGCIEFGDGSRKDIQKIFDDPLLDLTFDVLKEGGQVLIFTFRRKSAVALASKLGMLTEKVLDKAAKLKLKELSNRMISYERNIVTERLIMNLVKGTAFHHAGLSHIVRRTVEEAFKNNLVKVVIATPTLAAGVNLPARRVIVADRHRFNVELGVHEELTVMEYKQMAGRAGRPKYDIIGESVLIARTMDEVDYLLEEFVKASPERITSKLSSERALRGQLLAEVASGLATSVEDLHNTLSLTLYAKQYYNTFYITKLSESALRELWSEGFVEFDGGKVRATSIGQRVSELYLDPRTASLFIRNLNTKRKFTDLTYLHLIASTPDMPKLYLRRGDREWLDEVVEEKRGELLTTPPSDPDDYEMYLAELKVALLLLDWIEEKQDDYVIDKYDIGPGDLYAFTQNAEWLTYGAGEIAKLLGVFERLKELIVLRERVKHGVKNELLELVSIKGIGRVRARALFTHGFRCLRDIAKADEHDLANVPGIGPTLAKRLKEALTKGELIIDQPSITSLDQYI